MFHSTCHAVSQYFLVYICVSVTMTEVDILYNIKMQLRDSNLKEFSLKRRIMRRILYMLKLPSDGILIHKMESSFKEMYFLD